MWKNVMFAQKRQLELMQKKENALYKYKLELCTTAILVKEP